MVTAPSEIQYHAFSCRKYPSVVPAASQFHIIDFEKSNTKDIEIYIKAQLEHSWSTLYNTIGATILENARGIFLWVILVTERAITRKFEEVAEGTIKEEVEKTPRELEDLYQELIDCIGSGDRAEDRDDAFAIFAWVCCASRPLTADALHHAMAVASLDNNSHEKQPQLDMEKLKANIPSKARICALSCGLIKFRLYHDASWWNRNRFPACEGDAYHLYEKPAEVAHLMHQSVHEFLVSKGGLQTLNKSMPQPPDRVEGWVQRILGTLLRSLRGSRAEASSIGERDRSLSRASCQSEA